MTGHESTGADSPTDDAEGTDYDPTTAEMVICDDCGGVSFTALRYSDGTLELECTSCPATKWGQPEVLA